MTDLNRLLDDDTYEALQSLARDEHVSRKAIANQAVRLLAWVREVQRAGGDLFLVERPGVQPIPVHIKW